MNIRVVLFLAFIGSGAALYFAGLKIGFSNAVAENNAMVAKVTEEALSEQSRLQQVVAEQSYVFNKAITAEKVAHEFTRRNIKKEPAIKDCVRSDDGTSDAILTVNTVRVLEQIRSSAALPEASDTTGISGEKDTATANDLASYAEYSISEYNQCAIKLNAMSDFIGTL